MDMRRMLERVAAYTWSDGSTLISDLSLSVDDVYRTLEAQGLLAASIATSKIVAATTAEPSASNHQPQTIRYPYIEEDYIVLAKTLDQLTSFNPDYSFLAARVYLYTIYKRVPRDIECVVHIHKKKLHQKYIDSVILNRKTYNQWCRDYDYADRRYTWFGLNTLMGDMLKDAFGRPAERPLHLFLRIAIALYDYPLLANLPFVNMYVYGKYIAATPTICNAGCVNQQLSSCFLLPIRDDSIRGIYRTLADCAQISQHGGGIGIAVSNIRARGSPIGDNGGTAPGIVSMLQVFNSSAAHVSQAGKRPGAISVYLEPWHPDFLDFLKQKRTFGDEDSLARNLFLGIWMPDLFMERVYNNEQWSFICPSKNRQLYKTWGDEFNKVYRMCEQNPLLVSHTMPAREIWTEILATCVESGTPYILYKDTCNRLSNQNHLGTIRCSNLCTEIIQFSSASETATCNLASISLPAHIVRNPETNQLEMDYEELERSVGALVEQLNVTIDRTHYPLSSSASSNLSHRPLGIGVQGLADAFTLLNVRYGDDESRRINKHIFEHIYYAALSASNRIAANKGKTYESFKRSQTSRGILHFDHWPDHTDFAIPPPVWDSLRERIRANGLYNSLFVALMPTASVSQILGNTENVEPYGGLVYTRKTQHGSFAIVNNRLVRQLSEHGLWSRDMCRRIIANNGSIANFEDIPADIRRLYPIVRDLDPILLIDMAKERAPFIDQSASMNLYFKVPDQRVLTKCFFQAWHGQLKTGAYYTRTEPVASTPNLDCVRAPRSATTDAAAAAVCTSCCD